MVPTQRRGHRYTPTSTFKGTPTFPQAPLPASVADPEIIEITAGAAHGDEGVPAVHSYNFGAIFVDDDGSLIVRVWHRRWSGTGFVPDLDLADNKTEGFAEYRLKRKLQSNPVTSTTADVEMTASLQMLRAVGARRTAYPTDLTIAELDERNVLIAPRVTEYSQRSDKSDVASLVETLESGGSILVLGEPGAGKTVLVYLVHRGLLERAKAPLSVSITDLTSADELTAESLGEAASRRSTVGASVDVSRRDLVYLVDGIDEAVAAGDSLTDIVRVLEQLPQFGTVLATCRTREFEDHLIGRLTLDQFSRIAVLDEWSLEGEFREFVGRLVSARLLDDETVLALVRTTPALVELVRRPLFARMLTFVRSDEPSGIDDSASLYSAYLRHLARTVDFRLKRTKCEVPNSYSLWQTIAWHLFTKPQFHQELLPASAAGAYLTRSHGLPVRCAQTVVQGLLDFGQYGTELQARFRHYSFFEFLVADHLATALVDRAMRDQRECWDLLSLDLPREIRRHLTRVLTRSAPKPVIELLLGQFLQLEQSAPDIRTRRVAGNLSAYILGRIGASPRQLRHLLALEHDDFLRTALYWALANANDQGATLEYLALLLGNQEMASLNRGYLLYYWGDLDRDDEPPFRDDIEGSDWSQTRTRTMGLMSASDYAEREGLARRTLDLVTFLDFVRFHHTVLTEDERRTIGERLTELGAAGDLATNATAFTREVLGSG